MSHSLRNRRAFLRQLGAASLIAPFVTRDLFARPPGEIVRHASFGAAGMALSDIKSFSSDPNFKLVCVAEVDSTRADALLKLFPGVKVYTDYRELLDKEHKNLDSVNVSTPDHMHAAIGMSAMQLGLNVYGQKPLTHDIYEARQLTEYAMKKKLVTQMGIQIHSSVEYRSAVQLVQAGAIGKVKAVHTWSSKKWGDNSPRPDKSDPVPETFKWDLWLGTAASRPFIGGGYYHPANWRKRLDFGTGTFGDMGCHIYDPVFKALDLTAPVSVRSEGAPPNEHNWASDAIIYYVFPGTRFTEGKTVPVTWYDGDQRPPADVQALLGKTKLPSQGSIFIGTKGLMVLPHIGKPILLPEEQYKEYPRPQLEVHNHWHQFLDAVRGKDKTSAHFGYAGPLSETVLLGGVATRFPHATLQWNAKKLKFTNESSANQYVRRDYRHGWEVRGLS